MPPFEEGGMKVPVIYCDERKAADAYLAHIALLKAERDDPALKNNPVWTLLRQDAYEHFVRAYEVLS
jgi:hypothetical protein